ncbi:MAG: RluA family pseudouridine synthase [Pseudomonadota bacterium]
MSQVQHREVNAADHDIRVDRWFKRHFPDVSFGQVAKWLREGQVRVDGSRAKPGDRVMAGAVIRIPPAANHQKPGPVAKRTSRERLPAVDEREIAALRSWILYQDDAVIALNKPPGLSVQGGTGTTRHLDRLLPYLDGGAGPAKLVHRLDKDTSGVILLGRGAAAAGKLAAAFKGRETEKVYWALSVGLVQPATGRIRAAIAKRGGGKAGEKMEVSEDGKSATSDYWRLDHAAKSVSWLALKPITGRTHQLRVHCAAIGHPIVGDGKYGGKEAFLTGGVSRKLHLHARALRLDHPDGGTFNITAPLPEHIAASFDFFGFDPKDVRDEFVFDQDG